jgi:hypothetical protein
MTRTRGAYRLKILAVLSVCGEPSYPESLPQLHGDVAGNRAALNPNIAGLASASLSRRDGRIARQDL